MRLYQPPLFSAMHSLRVPLRTGSFRQLIRQGAPETNKNSELWKMKNRWWWRHDDEANIVLVHASVGTLSAMRHWALGSALNPAHLGHLCCLATEKPTLHHELAHGVKLISVVGTQYLRHKGARCVPILWWTDNPIKEKPPERIASLFKYEEEWPEFCWYAFVRKERMNVPEVCAPAWNWD